MATQIDTIQVGDVQYEITLPSTATPSITGLTTQTLAVGGDATISGSLSAATATISQYLTVRESAGVLNNFTVGGNTTISGTLGTTSAKISSSLSVGDLTLGNIGCVTISTVSSGDYFNPTITLEENLSGFRTTLTQDANDECFVMSSAGGSIILSVMNAYQIFLQRGSYRCSVPSKSGTLALTSDIPDVPTLSAISSSDINLMFI